LQRTGRSVRIVQSQLQLLPHFPRLLAAPLRLFRRRNLRGCFGLSASYRCAAPTQSHFFGHIRTRSGIARSNHWIVVW
jgi:hypothetical protein